MNEWKAGVRCALGEVGEGVLAFSLAGFRLIMSVSKNLKALMCKSADGQSNQGIDQYIYLSSLSAVCAWVDKVAGVTTVQYSAFTLGNERMERNS